MGFIGCSSCVSIDRKQLQVSCDMLTLLNRNTINVNLLVGRYGTTTYVLPPYKVLHTAMMENDPEKLKEAAEADDKPYVIIPPKNFEDDSQTKQMLLNAGLWFM